MHRKAATRSRNTALLAAALTGAAAWAGCTEDNPAFDPDPYLPDACRSGVEVTETFVDFERPDRLDLLLVVDDSGDVEDLQAALADALPGFLDRLDDAGLDLQVGVASTDATGSLGLAPPGTRAEGCGANTTQIVDPTVDNWTTIAACNVQLGADGDPFQQALENAAALVNQDGELFRDRARTLILVVSNEDDCSSDATLSASGVPARQVCLERAGELTPVADLIASLQAASGTTSGLTLAVLGGPTAAPDGSGRVRPVCSSAIGSAFPANRLAEAVAGFGEQGLFENVCSGTLDAPLARIADEVVDRARVDICPSDPLEHEPLSVDSATGTDTDEPLIAIPPGEDGFVYLGPTAACPNGELSIAAAPLQGRPAVEITYCTESE